MIYRRLSLALGFFALDSSTWRQGIQRGRRTLEILPAGRKLTTDIWGLYKQKPCGKAGETKLLRPPPSTYYSRPCGFARRTLGLLAYGAASLGLGFGWVVSVLVGGTLALPLIYPYRLAEPHSPFP